MHGASESEPRCGSTLTARASVAGLYVLVALVLLVALTLVALPAETSDDRWLRIGGLMAAAGLAVWISPPFLVPAVIVVWLTPFLARELFDEGRGVGATDVAVLCGLLLLGLGGRYIYTTALQVPGLQSRSPKRPSDAIRERLQSHVSVSRSSSEDPSPARIGSPYPKPTEGRRGLWAGAPRLSHADAAYLLRRLRALDAEVIRTASSLHSQ
jgi:hypothetical protein